MYTLCPTEPLSYKSAFVFLDFSVLVDLALLSCRPVDNLPQSTSDLTVHLPLDGVILECIAIPRVLELRAKIAVSGAKLCTDSDSGLSVPALLLAAHIGRGGGIP